MHDTWKNHLAPLKEHVIKAVNYVNQDNCIVYPNVYDRFNAFNVPFGKVKVVILGQDPYHGKGQANGLAFSVSRGCKIPPSLGNIFVELENDLGISMASHGDLSKWTMQGVLLLNSALTVRAGEPNSHKGIGWEDFTAGVIKLISDNLDNVIFIAWGKDAIDKVKDVDLSKHVVIKSSHPSPYSAHRATKDVPAFFNSKPFSKCNEYLVSFNKNPIDWNLNF